MPDLAPYLRRELMDALEQRQNARTQRDRALCNGKAFAFVSVLKQIAGTDLDTPGIAPGVGYHNDRTDHVLAYLDEWEAKRLGFIDA